MNGYKNGFTTHSTVTYDDVQHTAQFLSARTDVRPTLGIVCGSGLGALADHLTDTTVFTYKDIPNFLVSTVQGHAGRLVFGKLGGKSVVCMQGRFHGYEGYPMAKITLPIRVMAHMGVQTLIVTNASGGLNTSYRVGDVMVMKDHINIPGLAGLNPLVGSMDDRFGSRFVALSDAYSRDLRNLAKGVAKELGFDFVHEGVYAVQCGPCFETVTECRLLKLLGADVTGMSSAPEVIVARQAGMEVLGISLVTNECVTEYDMAQVANHQEVLETAKMRAKDLENLVTTVVERIKQKEQ